MSEITCSGTGEGNVGKLHPPNGTPPVLGTVEGGGPTAAWGYLCAECTETWNAERAKHPDVHPRHFLKLKAKP